MSTTLTATGGPTDLYSLLNGTSDHLDLQPPCPPKSAWSIDTVGRTHIRRGAAGLAHDIDLFRLSSRVALPRPVRAAATFAATNPSRLQSKRLLAATKNVWLQCVLQPVLQCGLQRCSRNVELVNIFQQLHSDFQTTATNRTARRTLHELATTTAALAGHTDFAAVVSHLKRAEPATSTAMLNALLQHSPTVPLARRTVMEAFVPVVANRVARRQSSEPDMDDYIAEMLAALLVAIDRTAATAPHAYPATMIRRGIDRADHEWVQRRTKQPDLLPLIDDTINGRLLITEPDGNALRPTRADKLIGALIEAVHDGAVTTEDASFVARSIINGEPARIEAARRHYTERTLQKRLHRTVTVLARHYETTAA